MIVQHTPVQVDWELVNDTTRCFPRTLAEAFEDEKHKVVEVFEKRCIGDTAVAGVLVAALLFLVLGFAGGWLK